MPRYATLIGAEESCLESAIKQPGIAGAHHVRGCIQANKNTCPTPLDKAARVANYCRNLVREVEVIAHSCGVTEPRALRRGHVRIVQANGKSVSMDEIYPYPSRALRSNGPATPSSTLVPAEGHGTKIRTQCV